MGDWFRGIQSAGRKFRPGMKVEVVTSSGEDKSFWADMNSDFFTDWGHVLRPHYVEMHDNEGVLQWYSYSKKPPLTIIYRASMVVRHDPDGSFAYVKNRQNGNTVMNEQEEREFVFTILKAEPVQK